MDIVHIIGLYMFNDIDIENCSVIRRDVDVGGGGDNRSYSFSYCLH